MDEVLIDTNILVCAHQPSDAVKYERALRAIETLELGRLSAIWCAPLD
jgi:hypothetical protein